MHTNPVSLFSAATGGSGDFAMASHGVRRPTWWRLTGLRLTEAVPGASGGWERPKQQYGGGCNSRISGVHLQLGPCAKGPDYKPIWKRKAKFKQCKNTLIKRWLLKGQTHFLQSKNVRIKNLKGKKRPCVKIRRNSPLNQAVKSLISQAWNRWLKAKRCKKDANLSCKCAKNHGETIRQIQDERSLGGLLCLQGAVYTEYTGLYTTTVRGQ
jgi:hypothetical protein